MKRKRKLAFALGGGGARGALQVGGLRALLEAGIYPDMLTGTSAGAINAVFLSMYGLNEASLEQLSEAWRAAARADLFPANTAWLTMRIFFNRLHAHPYQKLRDFYISHGITPDLCFGDLLHFPVILVSADLNSHKIVYYGEDPHDSVLEGVLASSALPPWVHPLEINGRFLIDGGAVSNVPIEPAITHGATEVLALSLSDLDEIDIEAYGFGPFWTKYIYMVEARLIWLEMALAQAKNCPVHMFTFKLPLSIPPWNFSHTDFLLSDGYHQMKQALESGQITLVHQKMSWLDSMREIWPFA